MSALGDAALKWARAQVGQKEVGGNNRGLFVEGLLASVGLPAGEPWCCAFAVTAFQEGAGSLGIACPVPATGSCLHMWTRSQNYVVVGVPEPGDTYVLQHSATTGHVGLVIEWLGHGAIHEISGNTNEQGSREGNAVAEHRGAPAATHGGKLLGYLRFV